jgi:hypothetical protein
MIVTCKLVEYPKLVSKILKDNPIVLREKIKITRNQMEDFNASHETQEYIEIIQEEKPKKPKIPKAPKLNEGEQSEGNEGENDTNEENPTV